METRKIYGSSAYWNNYIDSIIGSIKEDKETIVDMLVYGRLVEAEISMILSGVLLWDYFSTMKRKSEV